MGSNSVKINCRGADTLPLDELKIIQGNLKQLSPENSDKLMRSIVKHGFIAPIFIWVSGDKYKKYNVLDGTQRITVLSKMQERGAKIPDLPVVYINAKTKKEAKEILLKISSQYGVIEKTGLYDFVENIDIDPLDLSLPGNPVQYFKLNEEDIESIKFDTQYEIIIELKSEREQKRMYDRLIEEGYTCRLSTL